MLNVFPSSAGGGIAASHVLRLCEEHGGHTGKMQTSFFNLLLQTVCAFVSKYQSSNETISGYQLNNVDVAAELEQENLR